MVLLTEYRMVFPSTQSEYRRGQIYMNARQGLEITLVSAQGEGVVPLEVESFDTLPDIIRTKGRHPDRMKYAAKGVFTKKLILLGSKLPTMVTMLLPKSAQYVEELSWNSYPYSYTEWKSGYLSTDTFTMSVETIHIDDDAGNSTNVFNLPPELLKIRHVDVVDIGKEQITDASAQIGDVTKFKSQLTGRGPLGKEWKKRVKPIMCAYKLTRVECNVPFQSKVEGVINQVGMRDFLLIGNKNLFCWIDQWIYLSLEDLTVLDAQVAKTIQMKHNKVAGWESIKVELPESKSSPPAWYVEEQSSSSAASQLRRASLVSASTTSVTTTKEAQQQQQNKQRLNPYMSPQKQVVPSPEKVEAPPQLMQQVNTSTSSRVVATKTTSTSTATTDTTLFVATKSTGMNTADLLPYSDEYQSQPPVVVMHHELQVETTKRTAKLPTAVAQESHQDEYSRVMERTHSARSRQSSQVFAITTANLQQHQYEQQQPGAAPIFSEDNWIEEDDVFTEDDFDYQHQYQHQQQYQQQSQQGHQQYYDHYYNHTHQDIHMNHGDVIYFGGDDDDEDFETVHVEENDGFSAEVAELVVVGTEHTGSESNNVDRISRHSPQYQGPRLTPTNSHHRGRIGGATPMTPIDAKYYDLYFPADNDHTRGQAPPPSSGGCSIQ
eukprot:PhF_6_TR37111/c0_g1_i3/m.54513